MSHSIKIDIKEVIAQHNADSADGSKLVLLSPKAVSFVEKLANDNGQGTDLSAAIGGVLAQAEMYHAQYESNMIERFVSEGRVQLSTDTPKAESKVADKTDTVATVNLPGMMGIGIKADSLEEALSMLPEALANAMDFGLDEEEDDTEGCGNCSACRMTGRVEEPGIVTQAREVIRAYEEYQKLGEIK